MSRRRTTVYWTGLCVILMLLIMAPLVLPEFWRRFLTEILIWGLLAMSSDILIGYTGMVSQIRQIIEVLQREGVAILLAEQNVPLTLEASHRVYIMEKGAVRHHCAASDLKVNDAVIHQYLGV